MASPAPRSGFVTELDVRWIPEKQKWQLLAPLIWIGLEGDRIVVPAGYLTDFASTPRILQNIFPPTGAWTKAAVIHDWLCDLLNEHCRSKDRYVSIEAWEKARPTFSAVDADNVFRLIMIQEGTTPWAAQFGWVGVRYGAMFNPARRRGTFSTLFEVTWWSLFYLFILALFVVLGAGLGAYFYQAVIV